MLKVFEKWSVPLSPSWCMSASESLAHGAAIFYQCLAYLLVSKWGNDYSVVIPTPVVVNAIHPRSSLCHRSLHQTHPVVALIWRESQIKDFIFHVIHLCY